MDLEALAAQALADVLVALVEVVLVASEVVVLVVSNIIRCMSSEESIKRLERHGIKPTSNRIVAVRALETAGRPLSLLELETKIQTIDKSGVFRALTLFREHHLVHVIEDGGDGVRYELCHSHDAACDDDVHAHFYCEKCKRTYCLDDMKIPPVTIPGGFVVNTVNYMMKGLCPHCNEAHR